ncbi:MAG: Lipoprotein signal peptidase [Candidatus Ordinivivax streblomastigis]|uniref:Lipoprotein signal peptidase n=1 Tax=Candidatus Ordinivivax streblomastigis TaxID=2540710 RepID=A0A5M8P1Y9_9BACT|nr:MAG: Lipoprotein signal peptidase [Candidatus Ordinivivax streblomastigis]
MKLSKGSWAILIIGLVLLLDQLLKIWIKTHMLIGEDIWFTSWFSLRFVENNGMAMGIEVIGKLFLSIFRIVASFAIIYYLYLLVKNNFKLGYIICVSMIFAGAFGNIIDSIFYGIIFSESTPYTLATLFPPEGGYGDWLRGRVVDMFYFPLFESHWPSWLPWIGGDEFVFFRYIFNLADAFISVGIAILLLFYRNTFSESFESIKKK